MKQCTIVAFGDSLTYGYGVLSHIAYPARLARQLPQQEPALSWHVYNSGINGETTREALRRLEMEEVSWFLEHFGEAFGLTLDRLQRP